MLSFINDIFNTREIATAIIILLFIIYALSKNTKKIMSSFKGVLQSFLNIKIITPIFIMFLYSLSLVYLLSSFGLWEKHQIKNYIFWLIGVGILTHFRQDMYSIKGVFKDTLSLIVIFQFFLTFYTFNLFFELILIFIISILTMVKVIIDKNNEGNKTIEKLINSLFLIFGFILLTFTIKEYLYNFDEFANSKTLYDFFVPTFLSIMAIPYFYLFFMFATYESSFIPLSYAIKDEKLLKYAKYKGMLAFNFDAKSFQKWSQNLFTYDVDKSTIKESIQDIKKLNKLQKNIYHVDINKGWHPFVANLFLKDYDIQINDYHRSYSDIWIGTSNYIKNIDENSDIYYKMEGNLEYIYKVELQLFFYHRDKKNIEKSYSLFVNLCNDLSIASIEHELSDELLNSLIGSDDLSINFHNKKFNVTHKKFDTKAYKLIFSIA
jgi:hypothetical protein